MRSESVADVIQGCETLEKSRNTKSCVAHGAVEALLGALKAHIENAEICGSVARAVSFLAEGEDDHKQAFVHGGALPLLVEACKRHVGVPKA